MKRILFTIGILLASQETNIMADNNWTPDWAYDAVWYQVFPERFRNGNPSNDPTLEDTRGSWPHDMNSPYQVHPWGSDWYQLLDYERASEKPFWWCVQRRRYGGDIQGIIDQLDYIQSLGVNALYLNPVFMAPSLHKYDGVVYHHIDPTFGPDPEGDRALMAQENFLDPSTWAWTAADKLALDLIRKCHERGIRVIFDGVFNHIGIQNPAFQDVKKNQAASPYADWFDITSWEDPEKGTAFDYTGWFGVRELPEWREDENGIVAGPRQYIFDITRRWMDPNGDGDPSDGIDGWRLDVAFCVKHAFWKAWRKHVKSINPEAYLTAEIVEPPKDQLAYLAGDEFDAVMNYNFAFACAEFLVDEKNRITATEFDQRLRELREAYDPCVSYVQQNLFGSHDSNRLASHIVNRDRFRYRLWGDAFNKSKVETNPEYDPRKPNAEEIAIQKLFVVFQMTYLGAPMVYYGDEVGMWGANDPCCRKPMVWDDLEYDDEMYLPDQNRRPVRDKVEQDKDLLEHYRKCIALRNGQAALRRGSFETLLMDDTNSLYGFTRSLGNEAIHVILNNSAETQAVPTALEGTFMDLLSGQVTGDKGQPLTLSLPPRSAAVLSPQP